MFLNVSYHYLKEYDVNGLYPQKTEIFLFNILTNITLRVSSTGIEINEIAITGIFSSFIEKTSTSLAEEAVEI